MSKKIQLSVIVIAKNEEEKINEAMESIKDLAGEIILVDTGSTDNTVKIAKKHKAKIIHSKKSKFSSWRNEGLKKVKKDYVFYLDADERVTPLLAKEIRHVLSKENSDAYAIPRRNIILGKELKHGGWYPDYVKRLFKKSSLKKWTGDLHEEPVYEGSMNHLKNPLIHLKHSNLSEMVEKTNKWSEIEAKLLKDSDHPKMTWWRFIRIMFTEFWLRFVKQSAYKDGPHGIIYGMYQVWSKFLTYAKLWEMQK